jgi:hypothetical protein
MMTNSGIDAGEDAEVQAFIDRLPQHLAYSEMAARCLEEFGPQRAWGRERITRHWLRGNPVRRGVASKVIADQDIRDFIEDRLGRFTLDVITADCKARFGADRAPSRSVIHRYWVRWRSAAKFNG